MPSPPTPAAAACVWWATTSTTWAAAAVNRGWVHPFRMALLHPVERIDTARAADIPVIGVDFGYTEIPMRDLMPDRLIGHYAGLVPAVQALIPA